MHCKYILAIFLVGLVTVATAEDSATTNKPAADDELIRVLAAYLQGVWESMDSRSTTSNSFRMRVCWNPEKRHFEGKLVKLGMASQEVGFSLGELFWIASPSSDNPSRMNHSVKTRSGRNGISNGSQWEHSTIFLDKSTTDTLITYDPYLPNATRRYRRIEWGSKCSPRPLH